ncbi:MAG: hypothetical protein GY844_21990 [Bradyrhizobium sp.]|nr:hypothetical protein [Bradyrhizobium sp.]
MSVIRTFAAVAMALISTDAIAQSIATETVADQDVREMLHLMDQDKNGTVSKEEFLTFMSQTFDRLDVGHKGYLEPPQLTPLTKSKWVPCSAAASETDGTTTCIGIPPSTEKRGR